MKRFLRSKKGAAALLATVVVAISAVGAFAYFTNTGSGTGAATVGTSAEVSLVGTTTDFFVSGWPGY